MKNKTLQPVSANNSIYKVDFKRQKPTEKDQQQEHLAELNRCIANLRVQNSHLQDQNNNLRKQLNLLERKIEKVNLILS